MTGHISYHVLKFEDEILSELKNDLKRIKICNNHLTERQVEEELEKLMLWLSTTPKNIVFRVNTLLCEKITALDKINEYLKQYSKLSLNISTFAHIEELIVINSRDNYENVDLTNVSSEIIVDSVCGAAVLRGAHIYAPGVLGMPRGLRIGDKVSVYVDIHKKCKKGLITCFNDDKLFIGNGIVNLTRDQIFANHNQPLSGIAITMSDTISCIPQLNETILPKGQILLQNLPSVICSRILNPQSGEIILDMCAAPGNKSTHIAALMKNKGTVIALEKNKHKFDKLISNIEIFFAKNVKAFCFDSTKAVNDERSDKSILDGPPFIEESFDKILLDGPCSALGQRPQINNSLNKLQLRSYVPLQRKLFSAAVRLLKIGGILVYSTCTITIAENEGIVSWALKTFPNLEIISIKKKLIEMDINRFASVGYNIDGLTVEQSNCLCRFGSNNDSVGFFIACFTKK